jgi:hypothetical protein
MSLMVGSWFLAFVILIIKSIVSSVSDTMLYFPARVRDVSTSIDVDDDEVE